MDKPNYITLAGLETLRARYSLLFKSERPALVDTVSWAAGNGDRSENGDYIYGKKRLREIDRELGWLSRRIKASIVVDPAEQTDTARVWFGATVIVTDPSDNHRTVTLLGDDEADTKLGQVGWNSPFGKALRGATIGDLRFVVLPQGEVEFEVMAISYR